MGPTWTDGPGGRVAVGYRRADPVRVLRPVWKP